MEQVETTPSPNRIWLWGCRHGWRGAKPTGVWGRSPAAKERPRTGRGQDAKVIIRYNDLTLKNTPTSQENKIMSNESDFSLCDQTPLSKAVLEIVSRIGLSIPNIENLPKPLRVVIAGGAAMHLLLGLRVSDDVDVFFSHRVIAPADLEVFYQDHSGQQKHVWFDYNYHPYFGIIHPDASDDAIPVRLSVDIPQFSVSVLHPVDLAISKLKRFASRDREDIQSLIDSGLIKDAVFFKARALESMNYYVGDTSELRHTIERVFQSIEDAHPKPREMGD
jgi:hypothetical protein